PNNIIISIVGNIRNPISVIKKQFTFQKGILPKKMIYKEETIHTNRTITIKKPIQQSYIVMGYNTIARKSKDSITLDIIKAVLGKGVSGKIFDEIRNKRGFGYDVRVINEVKIKFQEARPGDQKVFISNIEKAKKDFGWEPKTNINTGIGKLCQWVEDNKNLFQ
ncbi:MAG: insulinase family protein, partial [Nitrospinae bacterium]|nr:insulinase family protein [Nitrospinota bacterium]